MAYKAKIPVKPTWRGEGQSHRHRLSDSRDRSLLKIHRGGVVIIRECLDGVKLTHEDVMDLEYACQLLEDCAAEYDLRLRELTKSCKSKPFQCQQIH